MTRYIVLMRTYVYTILLCNGLVPSSELTHILGWMHLVVMLSCTLVFDIAMERCRE